MKAFKINHDIFEIVGNGAISTVSLGEGRLIPAIIIDITENKEIYELFKLHNQTPPGDATMLWSMIKNDKGKLVLNFEFINPLLTKFGIKFHLDEHYSIVDGIIQSRGLYLQLGKEGDKIFNNADGRILVEVPNMNFDDIWRDMLNKILKRKYKSLLIEKKFINLAIQEHISKMREFWHIRK
jgi:hypothetical protein